MKEKQNSAHAQCHTYTLLMKRDVIEHLAKRQKKLKPPITRKLKGEVTEITLNLDNLINIKQN